jgi:hypothetical protein
MDDKLMSNSAPAPQPQLTQARVPLDETAHALMFRDASGRIPIIVVPQRTGRANIWLITGGAAVMLAVTPPLRLFGLGAESFFMR